MKNRLSKFIRFRELSRPRLTLFSATLEALVGPNAISSIETENNTAKKAQDVSSEQLSQSQVQTLNQSQNWGELIGSAESGDYDFSVSPQMVETEDQSQSRTRSESIFDLGLDLRADLPPASMISCGCASPGQTLSQRLLLTSADLMLSDFTIAEL
jgi:hypothetical protein